ncbi:small nucleolar ribonucleoprotein complex subunit [Zymoseptoria brevis]|uniref:Small nucleolar ribonucleoprotein complex subunit n=1 Tax=Zymoseptoria brevis TaxID=1047168 RepID=A0A0F4G5T2_9PEZI|nr:small nucleolar ribonucleoprotein complex subunit [Zymoseptoria brevis]
MSRTATMAKPKSSKATKQKKLPIALLDQQDESEEESEVEIKVDGEIEKDETEEELERLVFGDSAGFKAGLKDFDEEGEAGEEDGTGLEGLDDAALFFTDLGPEGAANQIRTTGDSDNDSDDNTLRSRHAPAWEDSDDERTMVSLASVPRLRKLRRTEAEDVVSGKDYTRRLRKQFELLNPVPHWAQHAMQKPARKKRRLSDDNDASSDGALTDEDMDSDLPTSAPLSKLLQNAESLVRQSEPGTGKKRKLRPEVIDIQRQKDIPGVQPSAITSLSFHPTLPLLLSSGPSSTLYLHHLSASPPAPSPNPLLTSLHIHGSQLTTTAFHPTDSRIFLSARRRYFHIWNLATGRVEKISRVYGQQHEQKSMERFKLSPDGAYMALLGSTKKGGGVINILDSSTLQWTSQVRIEARGGVAEFAWWRNSAGMCIASKSGEITEWDVRSQRVVARWQDEGAVGTTTLSLGGQHEFVKSSIGTDRWIAIGSSSGIVNIYDRRVWAAEHHIKKPSTTSAVAHQEVPETPSPTKTLDHLTTPTSHLVFSPDGQILAMASKWKRDAMRLVHLPSCTVYRNWPTSSTPLGRITGVAWASGGVVEGGDSFAVLAVANEQGKIRVWEVR